MTAHNEAGRGDIAKTVLMPGDPLRAKFVAETYLEEPRCFNRVRNMLGYTGKYKGVEVSVMGSGMGMPSIGIYSYELFHFFGVERILRIGSAGGMAESVKPMDLLAAVGASTNSRYGEQYGLTGSFAPIADFSLLQTAAKKAEELGMALKAGNILSSDIFYDDNPQAKEAWRRMGVLAVEMEAAALYMNAARAGKQALCLLTVSDHVFTGESLPAKVREQGFGQMVELALEVAAVYA